MHQFVSPCLYFVSLSKPNRKARSTCDLQIQIFVLHRYQPCRILLFSTKICKALQDFHHVLVSHMNTAFLQPTSFQTSAPLLWPKRHKSQGLCLLMHCLISQPIATLQELLYCIICKSKISGPGITNRCSTMSLVHSLF